MTSKNLKCPICDLDTKIKINSKGLDGLLGLHIEKKHSQEDIARYILYKSVSKKDIWDRILEIEKDIDVWNESAKENGDQGYYASAASDQVQAEINTKLFNMLNEFVKDD